MSKYTGLYGFIRQNTLVLVTTLLSAFLLFILFENRLKKNNNPVCATIDAQTVYLLYNYTRSNNTSQLHITSAVQPNGTNSK